MLPSDGGAMTEAEVKTLRLRLSQAGFHWLPEIARLKHPGKEHGDWRERAGTYDWQTVYANAYGPLLNTALYADDLFIFDFDVDDAETMDAITTCQHKLLGKALCTRYRPNSPRRAALYRANPSDRLYRALKGSDGGVEVMHGPACKLTSFGEHQDKITKVVSRMLWDAVPGNVRKQDLTAITPRQRDAFLATIREALGDILFDQCYDPCHRGEAAVAYQSSPLNLEDFDLLLSAVRAIKNTADWRGWYKMGAALYAATGGADDGLLMWCEWTHAGGFEINACQEYWDKFHKNPPNRIGAGSIFYWAKQNGWLFPPKESKVQTVDPASKLRDFVIPTL